ncbi:MAG: HD domain-containing protein [Hungatella sp.]|nr:HD domain-containing protein [Hungatella sp.]
MGFQILKVRKKLKSKLSGSRYEHSLSVSFTCACLAMRYEYPLQKAELAGLIHDCAKCYDDVKIIKYCDKHNIPVSPEERKAPAVLHAKYGAWLAKKQYHIDDEEILSAVACHTTGKPDMQLLDKILYVADYIEARRDKASNLTAMRKLAFEDLDEALYQIMKGTLAYLNKKGSKVDPMTAQAFAYYEEKKKTAAIENCE